MQIENGDNNHFSHNTSGMQDLRSYSASYSSSTYAAAGEHNGREASGGGGEQWKFKKGKSISGVLSKNWSFGDPELQRKKRVASYKVYTVEGQVKGSFKKSFRWIKERCNQMFHGYNR